jgi:hypothetical protein
LIFETLYATKIPWLKIPTTRLHDDQKGETMKLLKGMSRLLFYLTFFPFLLGLLAFANWLFPLFV